MEYNNSDYKQYIRALQEALSRDYFAFPFDEIENNPDQELLASEDEINQLKKQICRINNALRIHQFNHIVQTCHRNYGMAMLMGIPNDWKLDSESLFQILGKMPQISVDRVIRCMDCDNASILKEICDAIKDNDFHRFHTTIKENNINTSSISKVLSLFETAYNDTNVSDFINAEDELERIIAWEQIQRPITCYNEIVCTSFEENQVNIGFFNKIVCEWLANEKQPKGVDLSSFVKKLGYKMLQMQTHINESESIEDFLYRLGEYIEFLEPITLKNLSSIMFFQNLSDAEYYIITRALAEFGLTSRFEDFFGELKEAWESYKTIGENGEDNTFAVPSDLFSNLSYISDEGATNHFDGTKLRKAIEPEALEKLINYLAIHNYIGNSDTEKYRLLYYITGKVVNSNVDYTGKLAWIGEATVIYNIVKNLFTGKGHYKRVRELVNFVSDKHGAERLEKQHIEKPGGMSGFVDIIADDDYKRFVGAAFKWTFKGDLKK